MTDREYRPRIPKYFNPKVDAEIAEMGNGANVNDFITKVLTYYFDMKSGNLPFQPSNTNNSLPVHYQIVPELINDAKPLLNTISNEDTEDDEDDRSDEYDIGL